MPQKFAINFLISKKGNTGLGLVYAASSQRFTHSKLDLAQQMLWVQTKVNLKS